MTGKEAIEILNSIQVDTRDLKHALMCSDLIETEVNALEEIQIYRSLENIRDIKSSMELKYKIISALQKERDYYDIHEKPINPIDIIEIGDIREHKGKYIAYNHAIEIVNNLLKG